MKKKKTPHKIGGGETRKPESRTVLADNVRRLILEKEEVSVSNFLALCNALKCTPNDLFQGI